MAIQWSSAAGSNRFYGWRNKQIENINRAPQELSRGLFNNNVRIGNQFTSLPEYLLQDKDLYAQTFTLHNPIKNINPTKKGKVPLPKRGKG